MTNKVEELQAAIELVALEENYGIFFVGYVAEEIKLAISVNDHFAPAADLEIIPWEKTGEVLALYKAAPDKWQALYQWVADQRGTPNVHWRERVKSA